MDPQRRRIDEAEEEEESDGGSSMDGSYVSGDDSSYDSDSRSYSSRSASEDESRTGTGGSLEDDDDGNRRDSEMVYNDSFALSENRSTAGHSFVDGGDNSFLYESRDFTGSAAQQNLRRTPQDSLMGDATGNVSLIEVTSLDSGSSSPGREDSDCYSDGSRQQDSKEGSFSGSYTDEDNDYPRRGESLSPLPSSNTAESYSGSYSDQPSRYQSSVDEVNFSGSYDCETYENQNAIREHGHSQSSHTGSSYGSGEQEPFDDHHQRSASFSDSCDDDVPREDQSPEPSESFSGSFPDDGSQMGPGSFSGSCDDRDNRNRSSEFSSSNAESFSGSFPDGEDEPLDDSHPDEGNFSGSYDDDAPIDDCSSSHAESFSGSSPDEHHPSSECGASFASSYGGAPLEGSSPPPPNAGSVSGSLGDNGDPKLVQGAPNFSGSYDDDGHTSHKDHSEPSSHASFSGSCDQDEQLSAEEPSSNAESASGSFDDPEPHPNSVGTASFSGSYDDDDQVSRGDSSRPSSSAESFSGSNLDDQDRTASSRDEDQESRPSADAEGFSRSFPDDTKEDYGEIGTKQSSSAGRSGEVAQQSPNHSSEGVLANGSSANLTSVSGTDPAGQNSQSTEISHQSPQSNESWSSASDEDHQDQSSQPSGSDSSSGINATSTTKAAPTSCRDPDASDNRGFHNICCGGKSLSSNESKAGARPSLRQTSETKPPVVHRSANKAIRENSLEMEKSKLDDGESSLWLSSLNMSKVTQDSSDSQKPDSQEATKYAAQSEAEPSIWLADLEQGSVVEPGDEDTSVSTSESGTVDSSYSSRSQSEASYSDEEFSQSSSPSESCSSGGSRSGDSDYENSRDSIVSQSTGSLRSAKRGIERDSAHSRHASWHDDPEQAQAYYGESSERYQSDNGGSFSNAETWTSQYAESAHSLASRYASQHGGILDAAVPPSPVTPSGRTLATDAYDSFAADTPAKSVSVRERSVVAEYHKDLQLSAMQSSGLSRLTEGAEISSSSSRSKAHSNHSRDPHSTHSRGDATVDSLLETIATINSQDVDEEVSVLSMQRSAHEALTGSVEASVGDQQAPTETTPDAVFVENENLWSNTTKTHLSFETYSSHHRRSESDLEASAGTFDAFTVDNADFDAVPAPPQQLQNKESFGSFHKGDFFESAHVSRSSRSTSSHLNSRDNSDESGTDHDGSRSSHSYGTRSRSSNMTGDIFCSPTSISSSLQHSGSQ